MGKSKLVYFVAGLIFSCVVHAQITAEQLDSIADGTVGIETDLSADVWGDNPNVDDVIRQIKDCADESFNWTELGVLRQVLLTDVGGVKGIEQKSDAYLKARLDTLMKQGLFSDVLTLLENIPEKNLTDELWQIKGEALFASGRPDEACEERIVTAFGTEEAFIRAICVAVNGSSTEPALAYEVYRESGHDTHVFLNAAGDVLFRGLSSELPTGTPSVWEMPILALAFGEDIFQLNLNRAQLWTLLDWENIPHEVRLHAQRLAQVETTEDNTGGILDALRAWSRARQSLEQQIPPDKRQRLMHLRSYME